MIYFYTCKGSNLAPNKGRGTQVRLITRWVDEMQVGGIRNEDDAKYKMKEQQTNMTWKLTDFRQTNMSGGEWLDQAWVED